MFAPLRWELLNAPDTPSHAWADAPCTGALVASTAFIAQMTDPTQFLLDNVEAAPFVRGLHSTSSGAHVKDFWDWLAQDAGRLGRFARSMEGYGQYYAPQAL